MASRSDVENCLEELCCKDALTSLDRHLSVLQSAELITEYRRFNQIFYVRDSSKPLIRYAYAKRSGVINDATRVQTAVRSALDPIRRGSSEPFFKINHPRVSTVFDLLGKLSVAALLPQDELTKLIRSAPHRYKVFQVPKRAPGQFRTIAQPAKEVKVLQYWVMKKILSKFEIHVAAKAYRHGLSIVDNARPHTRGKFLLKMDFEDFFPSLKARDFRIFLKRSKLAFDAAEIEALCRILFWIPKDPSEPKDTRNLCLSIGAPTSPMLSNILMMKFDRRISAFCAAHNAVYTRYADDLTFSADRSSTLQLVEKAVLYFSRSSISPALTVNQDKTVRVSRSDSRRVTGLVLTQ